MRLSQTARKLNVGTETIIKYLKSQNIDIENNPNIKLNKEYLTLLEKEFSASLTEKKKAEKIITKVPKKDTQTSLNLKPLLPDLTEKNTNKSKTKESDPIKGLTMVGKLALPKHLTTGKKKYTYIPPNKPEKKATTPTPSRKPVILYSKYAKPLIKKAKALKANKKQTALQKANYQKEKKERFIKAQEKEKKEILQQQKILKVTEFITANELASLMSIPINKLLTTCMDLGIIASINQRLDAETIEIVADELGFEIEFTTAQDSTQEAIDPPENLLPRPPIVTVMGHVDHGKTSLLDYIRKAQVVASEAGSITQHIGAYQVHTKKHKNIIFLDTPGHEAFTAMRARGVQLTDIAIIIIAADDGIMPQTKEAISHAQIAGTPIVIAINKIDKPGANPQKIKEQLSQLNITIEEWGGKYQCQEISAKKGIGIDDLLEKILLEAELLSLKANPHKKANGIIIEASLDQGRGYLTTVMVKGGTLQKDDIVLAGSYYGKIKAMFDDKGTPIQKATPSMPVQILGLNGAPSSGEKFKVVESKQTARDEALKKEKILRNQRFRAQSATNLEQVRKTLDTGSTPEINILIKGDVDGSIEALADEILKLSTEKIKTKVIYKAVGPISESDITLAAASQATIIGFQTKLTPKARAVKTQEKVKVKLYTVIYDAIDDIKKTIEELLTPEKKQEALIAKAEVIKIFTFPDIGTIAGCKVLKGNIHKEDTVRCKRKNKILYTGPIKELQQKGKPIQEAKTRSECGISFENFHDILVGDTIEIVQA